MGHVENIIVNEKLANLKDKSKEEQLKIVWMWCKQGAIKFGEFSSIMDYIYK